MKISDTLELIVKDLNGIMLQQHMKNVTKKLLEKDIDKLNEIIRTLKN